MNKVLILTVTAVVASLAAGCSSSSSKTTSKASGSGSATTASPPATTTPSATPSPAAGSTTLQLGVVSGSLMFDKTTLSAKAGKVTLVLKNNDAIGHSIAVDDPQGNGVGKEGPVVPQGGTSSTTFDAKPGVYKYYCTVHEGQKMVGQLTVT